MNAAQPIRDWLHTQQACDAGGSGSIVSVGIKTFPSSQKGACLPPLPSPSVTQPPSQSFPHPHFPSRHEHRPPQHFSLGRLTSPNATPCPPAALATSGYIMTFMGSRSAPKPILRLVGGKGRAAARAKNRSRKFGVGLVLESALGKAIPLLWSIQFPHPSVQSFSSFEACSIPRC